MLHILTKQPLASGTFSGPKDKSNDFRSGGIVFDTFELPTSAARKSGRLTQVKVRFNLLKVYYLAPRNAAFILTRRRRKAFYP
jgi:hypothetical protein